MNSQFREALDACIYFFNPTVKQFITDLASMEFADVAAVPDERRLLFCPAT